MSTGGELTIQAWERKREIADLRDEIDLILLDAPDFVRTGPAIFEKPAGLRWKPERLVEIHKRIRELEATHDSAKRRTP